MSENNGIRTCLWLDGTAEETVKFYTCIFKSSKVGRTSHFNDVGQETHGGKSGSVLSVEFELNRHPFLALNGGPLFTFNESISFQILCDDQEEVDYYWAKLTEGGDASKQNCGWLADKYGLSWQVVPKMLNDLLLSEDKEKAGRATGVMLKMKKMDIAALQKAYDG
jgi:predicted 3-demethylubiquinone-9 3-methyltransferase (glyoxalase superfamily)